MKDMKVCNVFNAFYVYPVNTKHKRVYVMYEVTVVHIDKWLHSLI